MHRGTVFIITKDKDNKFQVDKSTEFNGGMGLDYFGKSIFNMLKTFKEPLLFDSMIRDFDLKYFKYGDDVMTYTANSQDSPYIDKNGNECFDYSIVNNQFKFFKDDDSKYIYTSDSNYIKNLTQENIKIVCGNGVFTLKPEQIIVTDYDTCINNSKISFGEKLPDDIQLEPLEECIYEPTKKQKMILESIIETFKSFGYRTSIYDSNNGIEIETWTTGGVDMIHNIEFYDDFIDLYDIRKVDNQIKEISEMFSVDDEIDIYRQSDDYREHFSIRDSLEDFEEYEQTLENMSKEFLNKYHEIIYQKFIKTIEKEECRNEITY